METQIIKIDENEYKVQVKKNDLWHDVYYYPDQNIFAVSFPENKIDPILKNNYVFTKEMATDIRKKYQKDNETSIEKTMKIFSSSFYIFKHVCEYIKNVICNFVDILFETGMIVPAAMVASFVILIVILESTDNINETPLEIPNKDAIVEYVKPYLNTQKYELCYIAVDDNGKFVNLLISDAGNKNKCFTHNYDNIKHFMDKNRCKNLIILRFTPEHDDNVVKEIHENITFSSRDKIYSNIRQQVEVEILDVINYSQEDGSYWSERESKRL